MAHADAIKSGGRPPDPRPDANKSGGRPPDPRPDANKSGGRPPDPRGSEPSLLVIGCGALARELLEVISLNGLVNVRVECLPAILHNTPDRIPGAVRSRLENARGYDAVYVAYGDCGTGGRLDAVLDEFGVERLPGAHCYQFFAGGDTWQRMQEDEPGTLYLTDFLSRHFDRIVWHGLGLDRWPELLEDYFGNYRRVVFLAQTDDPHLDHLARQAAQRLGLAYERHHVGYGDMEPALLKIGGVNPGARRPPSNPPTTPAASTPTWIGTPQ